MRLHGGKRDSRIKKLGCERFRALPVDELERLHAKANPPKDTDPLESMVAGPTAAPKKIGKKLMMELGASLLRFAAVSENQGKKLTVKQVVKQNRNY